MLTRIVTHNDFDGIISAALCSMYFSIDRLYFTIPTAVTDKEAPITDTDILCDLPYSYECGMWFDHHLGNREDLKSRGIDIATIPGCFALKPSCSRVIYDFLSDRIQWPDYLEQTIQETDIIDSFAYKTPQEWRRRTPAKLINDTLMIAHVSKHEGNNYLSDLVKAMRDNPLEDVVRLDWVNEKIERYRHEEKGMIKIIKESIYFSDLDHGREVPIIDLTHFKRRPYIVRALAFTFYPESKAVIVIQNQYRDGIKLNNLNISMSLGFYYYNKQHGKDVSAIMSELALGDGHPGAAGGRIRCSSKQDMLKKKQSTLNEIIKLWQTQPEII